MPQDHMEFGSEFVERAGGTSQSNQVVDVPRKHHLDQRVRAYGSCPDLRPRTLTQGLSLAVLGHDPTSFLFHRQHLRQQRREAVSKVLDQSRFMGKVEGDRLEVDVPCLRGEHEDAGAGPRLDDCGRRRRTDAQAAQL